MVKRPEQMRVIDGYRVRLRLPADHATTGGASKRRCRTALFVEGSGEILGAPTTKRSRPSEPLETGEAGARAPEPWITGAPSKTSHLPIGQFQRALDSLGK